MLIGHLLGPAVCLVLLAGPSAAQDLSEAEIRKELIDRSISWWEQAGWHHGSMILTAEGHADIAVHAPAPATDRGRWSLKAGKLCTAWSALRHRAVKCYTVRRSGDRRYVTSGGNVFEIREAGV